MGTFSTTVICLDGVSGTSAVLSYFVNNTLPTDQTSIPTQRNQIHIISLILGLITFRRLRCTTPNSQHTQAAQLYFAILGLSTGASSRSLVCLASIRPVVPCSWNSLAT